MPRFLRWAGGVLLGLAALCAGLYVLATVDFGRPPADTDMLVMWQAMTLVVGVPAAVLGALLLGIGTWLQRYASSSRRAASHRR